MFVGAVRGLLLQYAETKELRDFKAEIADAVVAQLNVAPLNKDNLDDKLKKDILSRISQMRSTDVSPPERDGVQSSGIDLNELMTMFTDRVGRTNTQTVDHSTMGSLLSSLLKQ